MSPEADFTTAVLAALIEHEGEAAGALLRGDYDALRASRVACADAISAAACALAERIIERIADTNERPTATEDALCE